MLLNYLVLDSGDYGALQDSGLSVQKTGIQGEQRKSHFPPTWGKQRLCPTEVELKGWVKPDKLFLGRWFVTIVISAASFSKVKLAAWNLTLQGSSSSFGKLCFNVCWVTVLSHRVMGYSSAEGQKNKIFCPQLPSLWMVLLCSRVSEVEDETQWGTGLWDNLRKNF